MKNLSIPIGSRIGSRKKLAPQEILCLRGEINYTYVFLRNGSKILVCTTLKALESRFNAHGFFRVHKSALVNLDYIESYKYDENGGEITLPNDLIINVSRRKNRILRTLI
jgi:DNA-binding LytR/AlgR family response regulator